MITGELKSKIDKIWDAMWAGGIANPLTVIEHLTYAQYTKDALHVSLANLDALFAALQHRAFRGEL